MSTSSSISALALWCPDRRLFSVYGSVGYWPAISCKKYSIPVGVENKGIAAKYWRKWGGGVRGITKTYLASVFFAALSTVGWVFAAVLVALADEVYNFTILGGMQNFFEEFNYVFIYILLGCDLAIGIVLLEDSRMRSGLATKKFSLITAFIVTVFGVLLPYLVNRQFFNQNILAFFFLAILPLLIIRFCSYAGHRVARPVEILRELGTTTNDGEAAQ